jgi:glycosyltransferase involved in cell wall biosynthesis
MSAAPKRAPRVFIGLRDISGYGRGLKLGFDHLGIDSVFLSIGYHHHEYETGNNPAWANRLSTASKALGKYFTGEWWKRILWIGFVQNLFSIMALPRAIWRYDAFIYISVASFFFFLELPLLKLFRKKIVFVFLGSDTRPVYLNGYVMTKTDRASVLKAVLLARVQKYVVWVIDRLADTVVNIPPQAYFHTRPVVSGYHIGFPGDFASHAIPSPPQASRRVRILHAPSKPGPKGTQEIRRVIDSLRSKGLDFDYVEITGRPHVDVLAEIQRATFVIDELYSDTPLAGFATEAAYFGKPAVVGSYYAEQIKQVVAPVDMPPSLFCDPDLIEAAIERMITDSEFREDLGKRAQRFLHEQWSARLVAERFLSLIDGKVDSTWLFDPYQIRYVEGCGLQREHGSRLIHAIISAHGPGALSLNDKPELLELLKQHANRTAGTQLPLPATGTNSEP